MKVTLEQLFIFISGHLVSPSMDLDTSKILLFYYFYFYGKSTMLYQCRILRISSYTIYIPTPNLQQVGSSEPIFKKLKKKKNQI